MPLAASAPWPGALDTLTPLGFHPSYDDNTIVPVTSPGVPLLMAAFNLLAGHCAMFWVFPLTGALLVWTTFAIGRRVVSPAAGAAASWLVATSPTFVMMSKATMSDVPAAAFWALAVAGLLRRTTTAAWLAGLSASVAILVRSNLLPVGLWLGAWVAWREWRSRDGRWQRPAVFALGAAPGCALIASLNTTLRGSPLASGYGGLDDLFSIAYAAPSIQRYVSWVIETQTVLWIAGALALIVPARRLWRTDDARQAAILLAGVVATVWTGYFFYQPFEAWWFLRFMLPSWPALAIGTSALVLALGDAAGRTGRRCSVGVIVALGLFGAFKTRQLGVFAPGEGERRYATIAELVAQHTEPTAVIFTMQNSGAVRYYAGRLTLRYDMLDPAWLDRTVEWLERSGRHPYFLLEDWEVPAFRQRFAAQNRWGREEMAPVLAYKAHAITGFVFLFDPRRPEGPTNTPPSIRDPKPRCAPPSQTAVH
jgi:4-amino-4-deoxy-L-arabinose transferase-like glycosyltransferase